MTIYIVTDTADTIADLYSHQSSRTAAGQAALDAGGVERDGSEFPWVDAPRVADHFNGLIHLTDAPSRAIDAAIGAEQLADSEMLLALRDVEIALEADVGEITVEQVALWRAGINGVTTLALFQTYEKRATLFLLKFIRHYLRSAGLI